MKVNKDKMIALIMPVFFTIFGIWVIMTGTQMGVNLGQFPRLIGYFTLAVALFHLVDVLRRKDFEESSFHNSNLLKVLELLAVLAIYIYMFKKAGYFICTSLLMFYVILAQGYNKYLLAAVSSVGFTAVVFVIFKLLLKVPLPTIWLTF